MIASNLLREGGVVNGGDGGCLSLFLRRFNRPALLVTVDHVDELSSSGPSGSATVPGTAIEGFDFSSCCLLVIWFVVEVRDSETGRFDLTQ